MNKSRYEHSSPEAQDVATLDQAAAVQDTWYTVLDESGELEIDFATVRMDTLAEDVEIRFTFDGLTAVVGTQAGAVAGTYYFAQMYSTNAGWVVALGTSPTPLGRNNPFKCRRMKIEIRKTSNNGANNLKGSCGWHKY